GIVQGAGPHVADGGDAWADANPRAAVRTNPAARDAAATGLVWDGSRFARENGRKPAFDPLLAHPLVRPERSLPGESLTETKYNARTGFRGGSTADRNVSNPLD